jgi:hypothetical protein
MMILLSLLLYSSDLLAGQDTVWLKYDSSPLFFHDEVGKHPLDPHPQDYFPFTGLHGYRLIRGDTPASNTLYFVFASSEPEGTGIPFYFLKKPPDKLNQIDWVTEETLLSWSYLDLIRYFKDESKVIMLYDTTQPPGEEQYIVRVYFDFDRYE